jgi:hypothetical protein
LISCSFNNSALDDDVLYSSSKFSIFFLLNSMLVLRPSISNVNFDISPLLEAYKSLYSSLFASSSLEVVIIFSISSFLALRVSTSFSSATKLSFMFKVV